MSGPKSSKKKAMESHAPQMLYLELETETDSVEPEIYEVDDDDSGHVDSNAQRNDVYENSADETEIKDVGGVTEGGKNHNTSCDDDVTGSATDADDTEPLYYNVEKTNCPEQQEIYENVPFKFEEVTTLPAKKAKRLYENKRGHKSTIETEQTAVSVGGPKNTQTSVTSHTYAERRSSQSQTAQSSPSTARTQTPNLPPQRLRNRTEKPTQSNTPGQEEYSVASEPVSTAKVTQEEYAIAGGQEEYSVVDDHVMRSEEGQEEYETFDTERVTVTVETTSHDTRHEDFQDYRQSRPALGKQLDDVKISIEEKPSLEERRLPPQDRDHEPRSRCSRACGSVTKNFNPCGSIKAKRNFGLVIFILILMAIIAVLSTRVQ